MPEPMPPLTLYGRAGCHLCEVAAEQLDLQGVPYQVVDISDDYELTARYGFDIPVLARGDQVLLQGVFSPAQINRLKLKWLRGEGARQG